MVAWGGGNFASIIDFAKRSFLGIGGNFAINLEFAKTKNNKLDLESKKLFIVYRKPAIMADSSKIVEKLAKKLKESGLN